MFHLDGGIVGTGCALLIMLEQFSLNTFRKSFSTQNNSAHTYSGERVREHGEHIAFKKYSLQNLFERIFDTDVLLVDILALWLTHPCHIASEKLIDGGICILDALSTQSLRHSERCTQKLVDNHLYASLAYCERCTVSNERKAEKFRSPKHIL